MDNLPSLTLPILPLTNLPPQLPRTSPQTNKNRAPSKNVNIPPIPLPSASRTGLEGNDTVFKVGETSYYTGAVGCQGDIYGWRLGGFWKDFLGGLYYLGNGM